MNMIEKMARAICAEERGYMWDNLADEPKRWDDFDECRNIWRKSATAVLTALSEPTPQMVEEGAGAHDTLLLMTDDSRHDALYIWKAMLAAASKDE